MANRKADSRRGLTDLLGVPQSLVGRRAGGVLFFTCLLMIALITAWDVINSGPHTIGALIAIPIFAAAWLLSGRLVVALIVITAALRFLTFVFGGVDAVTAGAQLVVLPFLGVVGRAAAVSFKELRERSAQDSVRSRIVNIATSSESLDAVLDQILREMAVGDLRGGTIALIDEHNRLYIAAAEGDIDPKVRDLRLKLGEGIMGRVALQGRSILVNDLDAPDAPFSPTRSLGSNARMRSILAVPLRASGKVIGVLEVDSTQPGRFTDNDLALLEEIALAVSGVVQRTGALQLADGRLRLRLRELSTLLQAARGLARSLEPQVILDQVARLAAEIALHDAVGRRRATVWRIQGGDAIVVAEHDELGLHNLGLVVPVSSHPGLQKIVDTGRGGLTTARQLKGPARESAGRLNLKLMALAPIVVGDTLYGVVSLAGRDDESRFTDAELGLLEGMADLAGLALGNADRLQLERSRGEQLREHADRMASLDKVKSEFLRLASHELRGPLGVLRGYVSMLADGSLGEMPAGAARVMPTLETKLAEISRLIDQMLETARLEDSRLHLSLEDTDLRDLVIDAVEAMRPLGGPHHSFEIDVPRGVVPVLVDRGRVGAILTNLIDNAIKYSPDGGRVSVKLWARGQLGLVEVADQGLGIAETDRHALFTRFGRVVTPENSHIPGTGLGLYLSRELAVMHGGDIRAESLAGSGSTFTLELPLAAGGEINARRGSHHRVAGAPR